MQAWGLHTYEDFRPSNLFPTRSGLLGLLGACLGIDRRDYNGLNQLADSVEFMVRIDRISTCPETERKDIHKKAVRLTDYHTILEARRANRAPQKGETIQTRREYLFDAAFTVAVKEKAGATISLDDIAEGLRKPVYTPVLGRRSCPIARPLFFDEWQEAEHGKEALDKTATPGGLVYAEEEQLTNSRRLLLRDVPLYGHYRRFRTRMVFIHADKKEEENVSEPS